MLTFVWLFPTERHSRDLALLLTKPSCTPTAYWHNHPIFSFSFFLSVLFPLQFSFPSHTRSCKMSFHKHETTTDRTSIPSGLKCNFFHKGCWNMRVFLTRVRHLGNFSLYQKVVVDSDPEVLTTKIKRQKVELKSNKTFLQIWERNFDCIYWNKCGWW